MSRAIVVLSGGQDSTTCLYWALNVFTHVAAVTFNYGQKHYDEILAAQKVAKHAMVDLKLINLSLFSEIGDSALLAGDCRDVSQEHRMSGLPASFVPGRNLIFLTVATQLALKWNIYNIVTGTCQTDYSGYPDCRRETIDSLEKTLNLGMLAKPTPQGIITIHTPLMYLTKAQTVQLAKKFPGCWEALKFTHTCYNNESPPCGECPACKLRAKGFEEAGYTDPILE